MKHMDHTAYQAKLKNKSIEELHYIIKDCRETLAYWPNHENAGYYHDEIHYATAEIKRRKLGKFFFHDNFTGHRLSFETLREAKAAAKKQTGECVTIWDSKNNPIFAPASGYTPA